MVTAKQPIVSIWTSDIDNNKDSFRWLIVLLSYKKDNHGNNNNDDTDASFSSLHHIGQRWWQAVFGVFLNLTMMKVVVVCC